MTSFVFLLLFKAWSDAKKTNLVKAIPYETV